MDANHEYLVSRAKVLLILFHYTHFKDITVAYCQSHLILLSFSIAKHSLRKFFFFFFVLCLMLFSYFH